MSLKCVLCGKSPKSGKTVSHSHRATNRVFKPNLKKMKIMFEGKSQRKYVCTTCLKSGRVVRPSMK